MTILFCVLIYYITGYQDVASKFAVFLATAALVEFISETIGCISAIITKTATVGILVSTSLLTVGMSNLDEATSNCFKMSYYGLYLSSSYLLWWEFGMKIELCHRKSIQGEMRMQNALVYSLHSNIFKNSAGSGSLFRFPDQPYSSVLPLDLQDVLRLLRLLCPLPKWIQWAGHASSSAWRVPNIKCCRQSHPSATYNYSALNRYEVDLA